MTPQPCFNHFSYIIQQTLNPLNPPPSMKTLSCPHCGSQILPATVNVQANIAKCSSCEHIFEANKLLDSTTELYRKKLYPPHGSKIEIFENDAGNVELRLPPKGISGQIAFITFFAVAWLGFITFWTYMSLSMVPFPGNIAFALFSIPFWYVGFMMAYSVINAVREYQIVEVQDNQFLVKKVRPINSKSEEVPFTKIDQIALVKFDEKKAFYSMDKLSMSNTAKGDAPKEMPEVPTFQMGIQKISFFEYVEPEESAWLIQTLNDLKAERHQS